MVYRLFRFTGIGSVCVTTAVQNEFSVFTQLETLTLTLISVHVMASVHVQKNGQTYRLETMSYIVLA